MATSKTESSHKKIKMSKKGAIALTFGGKAAELLCTTRSYNGSIRPLSKEMEQAMVFHPQPFPPCFVDVATGTVAATETMYGSGDNGLLNDIVFTDDGTVEIGTGLHAKLEFLVDNKGAASVTAWKSLQSVSNGSDMANSSCLPRPRQLRKNKEATRKDVCDAGSIHDSNLCESDMSVPTEGAALREYHVCQHMYGDRPFCANCRVVATARKSKRLKRKFYFPPDTEGGKKKVKTTVVSYPVPNTYNMVGVRSMLERRGANETMLKAVKALASLEPATMAGMLLSSPAPGEMTVEELNLVGSAARNGAFPSLWIGIRRVATKSIKQWLAAIYSDDYKWAAGWSWAMIQQKWAPNTPLCTVLRRDKGVCDQIATMGQASISAVVPVAPYSFYCTLAEASEAYDKDKLIPATVRFVWMTTKGKKGCTVFAREKCDVLSAIKRGWRIRLVLCAPLPPNELKPSLPANKVHALRCVGTSDLKLPPCGSGRISPRFPSAPAIFNGEFLTYQSMWRHLEMRKAVVPKKTHYNRLSPLVVYFSWSAAREGARYSFKLMGNKSASITYGGVADDLMMLALQKVTRNVTFDHGSYADYTKYPKNGRQWVMSQKACEKEQKLIDSYTTMADSGSLPDSAGSFADVFHSL